MALTDTAIRKAKPKDKPYKVSDSGGLYLLVNPTGSKLWRVKYRLHGVERKLALGAYPAITLAEARAAREDARSSSPMPSIPILPSGRLESLRASARAIVSRRSLKS